MGKVRHNYKPVIESTLSTTEKCRKCGHQRTMLATPRHGHTDALFANLADNDVKLGSAPCPVTPEWMQAKLDALQVVRPNFNGSQVPDQWVTDAVKMGKLMRRKRFPKVSLPERRVGQPIGPEKPNLLVASDKVAPVKKVRKTQRRATARR